MPLNGWGDFNPQSSRLTKIIMTFKLSKRASRILLAALTEVAKEEDQLEQSGDLELQSGELAQGKAAADSSHPACSKTLAA